ncbi:MAG: polysaccharide deacetylase family protein [bacterium]
MKAKLGPFLKKILFHCGFFHLLRVLFPNRKVAILRYHAVVDPHENFYTTPSISLSVHDFERQVQYFAKRYRILSLDEVIDALRTPRPLPANAVVFTFDDGYADNFLAAQILKKHGGSGTFYLATNCVDRQEPLWLAELHYLIRSAGTTRLVLQFNGTTVELSLAEEKARQEAAREVTRIIKSNNRAVREQVRRQLREQLAKAEAGKVLDRIMLRWEQVERMLSEGMVIGGHTLSHLNLPNAEPEDAFHEIQGCREVLEEKLKKPIRHFSVPNSGPYAYYNDAVKQMVGKSGFVSSVVSAHGFADHDSDLLELHRIRTVPELYEVIATIELGKFQ